MIRRALATAASAAVLALTVASPAAAAPGRPANVAHDCTSSGGVWVIVQDASRVSTQACYRGGGSGLEALNAVAGVVQKRNGLICRINGFPITPNLCAPADRTMSPFWFYYYKIPTGDGGYGPWIFSDLGPMNRTPPPGSIEGWHYGTGLYPFDPPTAGQLPQAPPAPPTTQAPPPATTQAVPPGQTTSAADSGTSSGPGGATRPASETATSTSASPTAAASPSASAGPSPTTGSGAASASARAAASPEASAPAAPTATDPVSPGDPRGVIITAVVLSGMAAAGVIAWLVLRARRTN